MAERDFSEIAKLSERYNKDPTSRMFVQLADAYRKNNMIDEALDILQKGLQHHPSYALAHLILGKCHFDKRLYEQAKAAFEQTLAIDPQNIVALRMLAQTCEATKDEEGQLKAFKGILAIDPYDASAQEKLTRLESLQKKKEPLHTVAMAEEYEKQGDLKKALEIYEHLHFTDPTDIVLSQKVAELRKQLSTEARVKEEEKIEGLQVETYFTPDQLAPQQPPTTSAPEVPTPGQPAPAAESTAEELNILQPFEEKAQPPAEQLDILKPTEAAETDSTGPPQLKEEGKEETILPLEDFLTEQSAPAPGAPADAIPTTETPAPKKPEPAIEKPEAPPPEMEEKPLPALAPEPPIPQPSPVEQAAEKKPQPPQEALDIEEKMELLEPVDESTPPLMESTKPAVEEPKTDVGEPTTGAGNIPAQKEPPPATAAPSPAMEPTEKEEEEKKEQKPKEEDFQSFQDWLSGLLK